LGLVEIIPVLALQLFSNSGNNPSSLDTPSANNTQQGPVQADNTGTSHNANTSVVPVQPYSSAKMPVSAGRHTSDRVKLLATQTVTLFSTRDHNYR